MTRYSKAYYRESRKKKHNKYTLNLMMSSLQNKYSKTNTIQTSRKTYYIVSCKEKIYRYKQ